MPSKLTVESARPRTRAWVRAEAAAHGEQQRTRVAEATKTLATAIPTTTKRARSRPRTTSTQKAKEVQLQSKEASVSAGKKVKAGRPRKPNQTSKKASAGPPETINRTVKTVNSIPKQHTAQRVQRLAPKSGRRGRKAERSVAEQPKTPDIGPSARPLPKQTSSTRTAAPPSKQGISQPVTRKASEPQTHLTQTNRKQEPPNTRSRNKRSVSSWLDTVSADIVDSDQPDPDQRAIQIPGVPLDLEEDMASRDASTSRDQYDGNSTIKGHGKGSRKVDERKLMYRRVQRKTDPEHTDPRLLSLRRKLKTSLPKLEINDVPEIKQLVHKLVNDLDDTKWTNCYSFLDHLSESLDRLKTKINCPITNPIYFQAQVEKCRATNEAVLQRTIMMSVFHYYWLPEKFDWNCEGAWSQPKETQIPSTQDDSISLPKPDLSISFNRLAFTGEDDSNPAPSDIQDCLSPDGVNRCFPFIFMEVKRARTDLVDADMANLHNASQALYNMYLWMLRADHSKEFFAHVRVFTFVFNAQELNVRIHRARQRDDGNLCFQFEEFATFMKYTRDQICVLVSGILNDYAAKELYHALRATFKEVTEQQSNRVQSKRKQPAVGAGVDDPKRPRREDTIQHTGNSFHTEQLSIDSAA